MKFINLIEAKSAYQKGDNVKIYLREKFGSAINSSEIIEIVYDLQAGSYIDFANSNRNKAESHATELAEILQFHLEDGDSLLDVGTGEITILTLILNKLDINFSDILALDISWSRLSVGMKFYQENRKIKFPIKPFVADMKEIPLHQKCVDVITSDHGLEPNGGNLEILLCELFRVAKKKLVLFEPSYEINTKKGKARMDKMGYIKDIKGKVSKLGGKLLDVISIKNIFNPLNPTACYIIEPPRQDIEHIKTIKFCVPGTSFELKLDGQYLSSRDTGLVFPIIDEIPVLKTSSAILATSKF